MVTLEPRAVLILASFQFRHRELPVSAGSHLVLAHRIHYLWMAAFAWSRLAVHV